MEKGEFMKKWMLICLVLVKAYVISAEQFPLIERIEVTKNAIAITPGEHFKNSYLNDNFSIKYDDPDIDLRLFDNSILITPFVFDVLSTVFASGESYYVDSLDENVWNSFEQIRSIWECMYPEINWTGRLNCREKIKHHFHFTSETVMVLFSGGVDSTYSSIVNSDKEQLLFALKGHADSNTSQQWEAVNDIIENFASMFNFQFSTAYSRSPYIIRCDYTWRGKMMGNLRMIGKTIPLMIFHGISQLYVPSTVNWDYPFKYYSPKIDNLVCFGDCIKVKHDGADCSRCNKIKSILDFFSKQSIYCWPLKVCLKSQTGKNCSQCNKCMRTISDLFICGKNPNDFGFDTTLEKNKKHIIEFVKELNLHIGQYDLNDELELFSFNESLRFLEDNTLNQNAYSKWFYESLIQQPCIKFIRSLPRQPCFGPD
jgi:hypothetical protein